MEQFLYNIIKNKVKERKIAWDIERIPVMRSHNITMEQIDEVIDKLPPEAFPPKPQVYKRGKKSKPPKERRFTVRLTEEDMQHLDELKEDKWWSRGYVLRRALHDYYKKIQKKRKKELKKQNETKNNLPDNKRE